MRIGKLAVFIAAIIASACDNNRITLNDILAAGNRLDTAVLLMKGKWQGTYAELNLSYDTVFYGSQQEKLEYLLSGSVADSSLVKEVSIRDTFKLRPVVFEFDLQDSSSWTGMAHLILSGDSMMKLPATMNLGVNLGAAPIQMKFGITGDTVSNEVVFYEEIKAAGHISFQGAFLSRSFILVVDDLSQDSLTFSLLGGYGKMILARKTNPYTFESF